MVNTKVLAGMATAIISVSAIHIDFRRFSTADCDETYHIRKDTNLHDPDCKTFSTNEPPFSSFQINADDDMDDLKKKKCYATVYADGECKGRAVENNNMEAYISHCINVPLQGRSVRISCDDKPQPVGETKHINYHDETIHHDHHNHAISTDIVTQRHVHTDVHTDVRVVSTIVEPAPKETLMLYPGHAPHDGEEWQWCPMHYEDGSKGLKKVRRGTACERADIPTWIGSSTPKP